MARRKQHNRTIEHDAPTARNIAFDDEGGNLYAESVDAGHAIDPRARKVLMLAVALVVLYFVGLIIPKDLFNQALHSGDAAGYTFSWFLSDLQDNVNGLLGVFMGHDDGVVPFSSSMVRFVVIAMTGAGLALCGAVYQGSFRNALVSPSTLGVMSGATLGMMVWVVFFVDDNGDNVAWLDGYTAPADDTLGYLWSSYSLAIVSFIGCLLVVGTVLVTMKLAGKGTKSPIMIIIAGQVIGSVLGAISNSIRYYYVYTEPYGVKAQLLTDLTIASFYRNYTWIDLIAVGVPVLATFLVVMRLRRRMQLLAFSEGEARTMGVDVKRMQAVVVGLCTVLTAILISFCGTVGFVGFLVPHLARRLVGPNFSYLLPAATVLGAVFVLGAYVLLMATIGSSFETMVGMFISIGGAAVFLITALRGKGGARGEFR